MSSTGVWACLAIFACGISLPSHTMLHPLPPGTIHQLTDTLTAAFLVVITLIIVGSLSTFRLLPDTIIINIPVVYADTHDNPSDPDIVFLESPTERSRRRVQKRLVIKDEVGLVP